MKASSEPTEASEKEELIWRLRERVKELTALHRTSRVLQKSHRPLGILMERLVRIFQKAWQYPRITAVRIWFNGETFSSQNFKPTRWRQVTTFSTLDGKPGSIEVVYLKRRPQAFEGPFLAEERDLIESLAKMLEGFFNRLHQEKSMKEAQATLEKEIRERTAGLTEANMNLSAQIEENRRAVRRIRRYQEKLRNLVEELSRTEQRERRSIAADLHDHLGQSLALIRSKLFLLHGEAIFYGLEGSVEEIRQLLDESIRMTRSLTAELCPPILYELGLAPAIEWLGESFEERFKIPVKIMATGTPRNLPEEIRGTIFRVVRELLMNAIKHSQASQIKIVGVWGEENLELAVLDDGIGIDPDKLRTGKRRNAGFGLFHARERLRYLGGNLSFSRPDKGSEIRLSIPFQGKLEGEKK